MFIDFLQISYTYIVSKSRHPLPILTIRKQANSYNSSTLPVLSDSFKKRKGLLT